MLNVAHFAAGWDATSYGAVQTSRSRPSFGHDAVKEYAEIKRKHRSNEQQETKRKAATISRVLTQSFSQRAPEVPEEKRDFLESPNANRPYEAIAVKVRFGDSAARLLLEHRTSFLVAQPERSQPSRDGLPQFCSAEPATVEEDRQHTCGDNQNTEAKNRASLFLVERKEFIVWMLVVVFLSDLWTLAPPA